MEEEIGIEKSGLTRFKIEVGTDLGETKIVLKNGEGIKVCEIINIGTGNVIISGER